jgi:exonuclease SbcC
MIPLSLRLSGFISYLDPVELDFRRFDVACISGSNGAGKSSLLDAITWALFGVARKRDDSIIHSKADAAEVTFDFNYEGNTYRIQRAKTRGKPTTLEFLIFQNGTGGESSGWKPFTEKGIRDTEVSIQHTLHMDFDTFTNASFFLQGKADVFAQQRPADRKRILSSILGLDAWEQYRERASEQRRVYEETINRVDGLINEINLELAEEPERVKHLEQVETELNQLTILLTAQSSVVDNLRKLETQMKEHQKLLDALTGQRDGLRQSVIHLEELVQQRGEEQSHLRKLLIEAERIEKTHQTHLDAAEKLEKWERMSAQFHDFQARRTAPLMVIEAERARLEAECSQLETIQTVIEEAKKELQHLESEASVAAQRMKEVNDGIVERTTLEGELKEKERTKAQLQADNDHLRVAMNELDERIKSLEPVEGSECPTCGQPLSPAEREKLIAHLKQEGKQRGDNFRKNQTDLKTILESVSGLEEKLTTLASLDISLRDVTRTSDQLESRTKQIQMQKTDWLSTGLPRLKEIKTCLKKNTFSPEAQEQLHSIDKELQNLGYDAAAHEATRLFIQDAISDEEEFKELGQARSALAPLEREITGYQEQLKQDKINYKRLEKETGQAEANLAETLTKLPDIEKAYSNMLDLQQRERQQHMEVGAARQKVEVLDTLRKRVAGYNTEREEATGRIAELRTLERAFGKDGVPALLIEQALPEIESQANQLLDQLSDGSMSIHFSTLRDYKDKNRDDKRETLDITINDSGIFRDYEMYSGGEAFRINFAIRLALSKVLAQRAGARLQTLVIDEGFGSQDMSGRQRLIEAINTIKPDFEKILVITHMDEIRDAFPTRIEVEKTPRGSKITLT